MIIEKHPDSPDIEIWNKLSKQEQQNLSWTQLPAIGYWSSKFNTDLPNPLDFIDETWNLEEKAIVIKHLTSATTVCHWLGYSECRVCNNNNGSTDLSDGIYVWPEGFVHYIQVHNVKPPEEFIAHCKRIQK